MNGRLVPPTEELFSDQYSRKESKSDRWWRNMLENPTTVQFDHRVLVSSTFAFPALTPFRALLLAGLPPPSAVPDFPHCFDIRLSPLSPPSLLFSSTLVDPPSQHSFLLTPSDSCELHGICRYSRSRLESLPSSTSSLSPWHQLTRPDPLSCSLLL